MIVSYSLFWSDHMNNILIKATLTSIIGAALLLSPAAFAGHNSHQYSNNHSNGHHAKKYNKHYSSHKKHNTRYKRSNSHAKHVVGGIIGGVVIGSILENISNNSHSNNRYNQPHYKNNNYRNAHSTTYSTSNYQQPIAVNKTIIINNTPTQTYRVLNGTDCYLVNKSNSGNEIMTQVPKVNCGF